MYPLANLTWNDVIFYRVFLTIAFSPPLSTQSLKKKKDSRRKIRGRRLARAQLVGD